MARLLPRRRGNGWKRDRRPDREGMMRRRLLSLVWKEWREDRVLPDKGKRTLSLRIKRKNALRDQGSITCTKEKTLIMGGNHHLRLKWIETHTYRWQQTQGPDTTMWSWLIMQNPSSSNVHKNSNAAFQTKSFKFSTRPNPTQSQALAATNTNTPHSSHSTNVSRSLAISCWAKRTDSTMTLISSRLMIIKKTRRMCVLIIWSLCLMSSKGWLSGRVSCRRVRGWCLVGRRSWGPVLLRLRLRIERISILIWKGRGFDWGNKRKK